MGNTDCQIIVTVFDKACSTDNTPNDPTDDTFNITLRATATEGSSVFRINQQSETYTYGADIPILGLPISVTSNFVIIDSENPACRTEIDVIPPPDCPDQTGGQLNNLHLTVQHPATFRQYEGLKIVYEVTNTGETSVNDVRVNVPLPDGTVNTNFTVNTGEFSLFRETWTILNLAAGATARLTWNVFALAEDEIRGMAQIVGQEESQFFTIQRTNFRLPPPNIPANKNPVTQVVVRPTLVQDIAQIGIVATEQQMVQMDIFNIQGQHVFKQSVPLQKGSQTIRLTASHLAAGTYFLRIGQFKIVRFVKL